MHPVAAPWQAKEAQSDPNGTDFHRFTCRDRQEDTLDVADSCILSQTLNPVDRLQSILSATGGVVLVKVTRPRQGPKRIFATDLFYCPQ
jgi:hypothetical protein